MVFVKRKKSLKLAKSNMQKIDLAQILKSKNPRLARWVPRFVVGWIEALLKLKHHNEILRLYGHCNAEGFIDGALDYIGVKYELYGTENIPRTTENGEPAPKLLFAANHPLGGVDGMMLATAIIKENIGGVRLIVNDLLLNLNPLREIFVGVNKHGAQRAELNAEMDKLYDSPYPIVNFAAGLCSRKIKGEIVDTPWKVSYVNRCKKSERVVVPTYVEAKNSPSFYFFANLRKFLRIKSNLEMMLLPRQVFYQKGKTVKIYFGEPIVLEEGMSARQQNDMIRARVYELKKEINKK